MLRFFAGFVVMLSLTTDVWCDKESEDRESVEAENTKLKALMEKLMLNSAMLTANKKEESAVKKEEMRWCCRQTR